MIKKRADKIYTYILALMVPIVIYIITLIVKEVVPFGTNWLKGADFDSQYVAFYAELIRKLRNGESLLYTWNMGLGTNFVGLAAYYLISPLNILLFLFTPEQAVKAVIILVTIKVGLCGLNCFVYLKNRTDNKYAIVFSTAYALSMYFVVKGYNIMWLDSVALFPLVVLGLERLVKKKKVMLYTLTLGMAILSNYYIGYMICLFSVLYFIYLVVCEKTEEKLVTKAGRFLLYSTIAGCMAMVIIVPEIYALSSSYTVQSEVLSEKLVSFQWYRLLTGMILGDVMASVTYCTIGVFILNIIYVNTKGIDIRQRIGRISLCIILLISFWIKPLDNVWNGFHTVHNAQGTRYVFIFVFMAVTIAYDTFINMYKEKTFDKKMLYLAIIVVMFSIFMLNWHYKGSIFLFDEIIENIFVVGIYVAILVLFLKYKKKWSVHIFAMVMVVELIFSINQYYVTETPYTNKKIEVSDDVFSRTVDMDATGDYMNEGMLYGYKSIGTYSSIVYNSQWNLFDKLYGKNTINKIEYNGNDDMGNMLFSVKYIYKDGEKTENPYFLPLGYYIGNDVNNLFQGNGYEEIWKNFLYKVTDKEEVNEEEAYTILSANTFNIKENNISKITGNIKLDEAGYVFFSIPYDKGWSLTVNGKDMNIENIDDTFTYIYLEEGYSELTLRYFPRGLKFGAGISIASLLMFVFLIIKNKRNVLKE